MHFPRQEARYPTGNWTAILLNFIPASLKWLLCLLSEDVVQVQYWKSVVAFSFFFRCSKTTVKYWCFFYGWEELQYVSKAIHNFDLALVCPKFRQKATFDYFVIIYFMLSCWFLAQPRKNTPIQIPQSFYSTWLISSKSVETKQVSWERKLVFSSLPTFAKIFRICKSWFPSE